MSKISRQKMKQSRAVRNPFFRAPKTQIQNPNTTLFISIPITTGATPSSAAGGTLRRDAVVQQCARLAPAAGGELPPVSACEGAKLLMHEIVYTRYICPGARVSQDIGYARRNLCMTKNLKHH